MFIRQFAPFALLASLSACVATQTPASTAPAPQPDFIGTVSAADPRAQEAGMAMLRQGGNATDAAIATMLALNVVEPQSSGIGGGGFYVRGTAAGDVETIEGRETAPAGAGPRWFYDQNGNLLTFKQSVMSGLSVGVPGNVALAAEAHRRHGKLPWAALFQPAIELAREGFRINPRLHGYLERFPARAGQEVAGQKMFYDMFGKPLPVGTLVVNEQLAATFERIASDGPSAFYTGEFAAALAANVARATLKEGAMTAADLANYQAKERPAVCGHYRGYRICGMGPPSSGGVAVIQILGQLERFDLAALGPHNPLTWHLFLESQRLAYADRELYLADSDYISVPVKGLIDPDYIAERSKLISADGTMADALPGKPQGAPPARADGDEPVEHGTSHFAVVDSKGTMVSYTSTVEGPFGSGLMAGGFYLNNELTDFSRNPVGENGQPVANRVEGGKRPRSSMSPTVIWDPQGRPVLAIGAAGGATIPVQTARSIIGILDFGLPVEEALGLPLVMAYGGTVYVEEGTFMEGAIPELKALGHTKIAPRDRGGKAGAVYWNGKHWISARDPRLKGTLRVPE